MTEFEDMRKNERARNNEFGRAGEDSACDFLKNNGFKIISRNFRYQRMGEIDIIIQKDNLVVFIEVKRRNSDLYGGAHYSINIKKRMTLKKIATQFLITHPNLYSKNNIYRFDLISIKDDKIEWVEDIFR